MNRGGRPTDLVWEHFYKVERDGKQCAKCKYCGILRANRVERMRSHFSQCPKKSLKDESENFGLPNSSDFDPEVNSIPEEDSGNKKKKYKMDSFVLKTNSYAAQQLDLLVAKFFFANNISFNIVEHPTFKELLSALRPGYSAPTRKSLAGKLLDTIHAEIEDATKECLTGKTVTLIEDGWSNIHNDPVVATCLHSSEKSFFLDAIDCGSNVKNAEYHTQLITSAIDKAKNKFGCDVKAVVTDNARVMAKTRKELLLKDDTKDLIVYGCSSHWLNLFGQDITPEMILKHVVKVQKYFRNHHLPGGWLKECEESIKPQLPGDTRWNSQITCLETFIRNRPSLIKIVEEHEAEISSDIVRLINDFNLYKQCKDLILQLKPVSVGLDLLQRDTASLADSCHVWLTLMKEECLLQHVTKLKSRMEQAVEPVHFLAYLLHPKYRGEGLSDAQLECARHCAMENDINCFPIIIAYEAGEHPFPASYFTESARKSNPTTWWKGIAKCKEFKDYLKFIDFILLLLSCPASSAAIERVFSNFGLIHSKLRNWLGIEKCSKLVSCYRMLRGSIKPDF